MKDKGEDLMRLIKVNCKALAIESLVKLANVVDNVTRN
jgi:hypothetical protein